jgi:hypothetical protein
MRVKREVNVIEKKDSVWASASGIGQPGSASKPLWHREETLKTIHGYAT